MTTSTTPVSDQVVGHVFTRTGRRPDSTPIVLGPDGVHYAAGERRTQIDPRYGVLRVRMTGSLERGERLLGTFDPELQWTAMAELQCANCGRPAEPADGGNLWVIPRPRIYSLSETAHLDTTTPPVCSPACLRQCLYGCPVLRDGQIILRAQSAVPIGILGVVYDSITGRPVSTEQHLDHVAFTDDDRLDLTVAHFLTRRLRHMTEVPLTCLDILSAP
ncbi:hypothetical protein ACFYNX_26980 [Streptomyces sp. NPDC007872]|uniref:hypothetical protein n=1 Tax=Streptomyces sp. NPDC007872 TaxID=3364782 RepID=UPI0036C17BEF